MSTNTYLADQITNRAIDGIYAANETSAKANKELSSILSSIKDILKDEPKSKYFRLSKQIESLLKDHFELINTQIRSDLKDYSVIEAGFTALLLAEATTITAAAAASESLIEKYTDVPINNFITNNELSKPTPFELIEKLSETNARRISQIIRDGQQSKKTSKQVSKEILSQIEDYVNGTAARNIQTVAHTLFNHYGTQAREAVYKENSEILQGIILQATLDSRTTLVCQGYDLKEFELNKGPRPPFHYNCRTIAVPNIKEKYKIQIKGRTRASEHGPVDARLTFNGWLKRQGADRQDEILGKERGALFRRGLHVDKFTNDNGIKLSLDNLRKRYPDKFPH